MNKQILLGDSFCDYDTTNEQHSALIVTREELSKEVFGLLPVGLFPVFGQNVRWHCPHLHHFFQIVLALQ